MPGFSTIPRENIVQTDDGRFVAANLSNFAASTGVTDSSPTSTAQLEANIARESGELRSGLSGTTAGAIGAAGDLAAEVTEGIAGGIRGLAENVLGGASSLAASSADIIGEAVSGNRPLGSFSNILSLVRGKNLPAGGELFRQVGSAIKLEPNVKEDWRVKINANWELFSDNQLFAMLKQTGGVVFPVLPEVTFGTEAQYDSISPAHSNYAYQAYKSSQVRDISIMGNFFAETENDAAYWIAATTFFRTATKMFFGQGENVGNPPIICNLSGYGASMFNNVPVVIKSFELILPQDVNYIKCDVFGTSTWVPVMSNITVSLAPIYNRERQRQFNLADFAKGSLVAGDKNDGIGWV